MGSSSRSWTDNKWTTTAASILIQCTSGCPYTFSIYSAALKSTQHYDQSTLDTVSVFKDVGASAGILSGVAYTAAASTSSSRRGGGPWIVLAAGAIQCFAGYFLMWLSVAGLLPRPPVALMCFYMFMAAHATSFFNTGNVVTGVNNFPNYRGTIVGIMKGFLGLSGAMLIQVYQTILEDKPTAYILMLALLPTCNALLLMWLVRIYRKTEGDEDKHLDRFSFVSVVIAAYLLIIIILDNALSLPSPARICTFVILVMLLTSPVYVAMKAYLSDSRRISGSSFSGQQIDDSNLLAAEIHSDIRHAHCGYDQVPYGTVREVEPKTIDKTTSQWEENLNLVQAICTSSFWLLFIAAACGLGSGLATVNNISQIGASLGYTTSETSSMVSLWGIWNYVGRFGAGYVSEYLLHVNGWPRPLFMTITLASMSIGHVVIASAFPGALYIGSFLVGVCYGSQWSLMPTIVSEIFGVVHMGTIFNTITAAGPIGSYILSVRVIGYIYDVESSVEGGSSCSGTQCFRLSFFILSSATLLGSLAALTLFFLTKDFYQQAIVRRLHSVRE